MILYGGPSET